MEEKPEEAKEKPKTAEVVEQQPEFADVLRAFMDRTGQTRSQAASFIGNLLDRMRIDPERRTQEAINEANRYLALLETFPESPFKQAAAEAVGMKAIREMSAKPDPTERAARMMEIMAPYMMMAPAMREMARAMSGGGETEGKSAALAAIEAKLASVEEKLKEKPIEELKATVQSLREEIAGLKAKPKEEEGIGKKFDELKEVLTKQQKDEMIAKLEQQGQDLQRTLEGLRADLARPAEKRDIVDEITAFSEKANKFFGALAETAKAMGFEKKEPEIPGQDKLSKMLRFGEKVVKEVGDMVKTAKQPAPPREVVETAPTAEAAPPKPPVTTAETPAPAPEKPVEKPAEAKPEGKPAEEKPAEEKPEGGE
jgi:paraquat-inducible protein B